MSVTPPVKYTAMQYVQNSSPVEKTVTKAEFVWTAFLVKLMLMVKETYSLVDSHQFESSSMEMKIVCNFRRLLESTKNNTCIGEALLFALKNNSVEVAQSIILETKCVTDSPFEVSKRNTWSKFFSCRYPRRTSRTFILFR